MVLFLALWGKASMNEPSTLKGNHGSLAVGTPKRLYGSIQGPNSYKSIDESRTQWTRDGPGESSRPGPSRLERSSAELGAAPPREPHSIVASVGGGARIREVLGGRGTGLAPW